MCFDLDSRPPITPIAGGAADAVRITLTAPDGTAFSTFAARAAEPTGAGILILPDVRGLHAYYEELALRFAEHGVDALAIDYFGRTAGLAPRPADFDHAVHVPQTTWATLATDIRTGIAHLRGGAVSGGEPAGAFEPGRVRAVFSTGFCMGGRLALLAGTLGEAVAGVIAFYGWPVGPSRNGTPAPIDMVGSMSAPVLALYGGADQGIPPEVAPAFDAALAAAGVEHRSIVYEGAPHSFFDRKFDEYADASAAAWAETLDFIRAHTARA